MKVLFWGTYDSGKPRVRILINGLRENGVDVIECHADIWAGIEDKTRLKGFSQKLLVGFHWLFSYPRLIWCFMRRQKPDAVLVGYLGHLDVLVLWPFAKLRGVPVVWDAFISLYNTMVEDRKLIRPSNPFARLVFAWEWLACRASDLVLLDTNGHAAYFRERFRLPESRAKGVFVGAEPEYFSPSGKMPRSSDDDVIRVLFYGQFIPLHGIETIIAAARLAEYENIEWTLIGDGQEGEKIRNLLSQHPLPNVTWLPWVSYDRLLEYIQGADACLGVFGNTEKAGRVIPNKVFQILMAGAPLVTRDSPAIRELFVNEHPGLVLVPPADPVALVAGIKQLVKDVRQSDRPLHGDIASRISPSTLGKRLLNLIEQLA